MQSAATAEERLSVFAAASLKGALDEALALSGRDVTVSYGGSGLIARQVVQGAPADLVILANPQWMDWLESKQQPSVLSRNDFLANQLVLIGPADSATLAEVSAPAMLARLDGGRLAIGHTTGVPAGAYGRQWMEQSGLWDSLQPHLAQTDNVRAALALVARGETPLGVVYASDAKAEPRVKPLYAIPADTHAPIVYPMAVLDTKKAAQAAELESFLFTREAQNIFLKHGFSLPETAP